MPGCIKYAVNFTTSPQHRQTVSGPRAQSSPGIDNRQRSDGRRNFESILQYRADSAGSDAFGEACILARGTGKQTAILAWYEITSRAVEHVSRQLRFRLE